MVKTDGLAYLKPLANGRKPTEARIQGQPAARMRGQCLGRNHQGPGTFDAAEDKSRSAAIQNRLRPAPRRNVNRLLSPRTRTLRLE